MIHDLQSSDKWFTKQSQVINKAMISALQINKKLFTKQW